MCSKRLTEKEFATELAADLLWYAEKLSCSLLISLSKDSECIRRRLIAASYLYIAKLSCDWCEAIGFTEQKSIITLEKLKTRYKVISKDLYCAVRQKYCPETPHKTHIISELIKTIKFLELTNARDILTEEDFRRNFDGGAFLIRDIMFETLDNSFLMTLINSSLNDVLIGNKDFELLFLCGIRTRNKEAVQYGLDRGIKVNELYGVGYKQKFTPIMLTRGYCKPIYSDSVIDMVWIPADVETAEKLIAYGADVSIENSNGHNLLDLLFFSDNDCEDGIYEGKPVVPCGTLCKISKKNFGATAQLIELCINNGLKIRRSPKYGLYPYALCLSSIYQGMPEYLCNLLANKPEYFQNYREAQDEKNKLDLALCKGVAGKDKYSQEAIFCGMMNCEETGLPTSYIDAAAHRVQMETHGKIREIITGETYNSSNYGDYLRSYLKMSGAKELYEKRLNKYRNPIIRKIMIYKPQNMFSAILLKTLSVIFNL